MDSNNSLQHRLLRIFVQQRGYDLKKEPQIGTSPDEFWVWIYLKEYFGDCFTDLVNDISRGS